MGFASRPDLKASGRIPLAPLGAAVATIALIGLDAMGIGIGNLIVGGLLFLTPFQLTAPFGITWLAQRARRLPKAEDDKPSAGTVVGNTHVIWLIAIFVIGVLLA